MKGLLKKLEKSKFIDDIHKQTLWADSVEFMKIITETPNLFECTKSYDINLYEAWDLRVKFNIMASGFYDYIKLYSTKYEGDDLMLSCNLDDTYSLVAFEGADNTKKIIAYHFQKFHMLPVHYIEINLDYESNIHILMYNENFVFPGINLN